MPRKFPYSYISCPCSEPSNKAQRPNRYSCDITTEIEGSEEEETSFDPHHPRSNFSLFPLEHLLYCEECHDIKCPRCVTEEIICWFCPNCLFETPSSMVRSEGNRCARNCFNCPICTSMMTTSPIADGNGKETFYILNCNYCMWTTLDIGIRFDKPTNIRSQLEKIANGGKPKLPSKSDNADPSRKSSLAREPFSSSAVTAEKPSQPQDTPIRQQQLDPHVRFTALKSFYKDQLALSSSADPSLAPSSLDLAASYSSPSSLARIMSLYSTTSSSNSLLKKSRQKPQPMREALSGAEGLLLSGGSLDPVPTDYTTTTSLSQRLSQISPSLGNPSAREVSQLRPLPTLLRTKRAKRCLNCKHILTKPEVKPTSTRYRIRLLASNYIPLVSLRLVPPQKYGEDGVVGLEPGKPSQWILRMVNPLFERVRVSLGCPAVLPRKARTGEEGSMAGGEDRVTILCPQFEVGANADVWDDALNSGAGTGGVKSPGAGEKEGVAGKVFESGRNWVGVVVEVVPGVRLQESKNEGYDGEDEDEEDGVIEIPVRVRLEWKVSENDALAEKKKASQKLLDENEGNVDVEDEGMRELAYWMVLGVGRVERSRR